MTTRGHGDPSERGAPTPPRVAGPIARLLGLAPADVPLALLGALCSWLVMAAYYMLRPIRDEIGAAGARDLEWMFWATFAGTLVASPAFAVIVSRLPRARFIALAFRFFALNMLAFGAAFTLLDGDALRASEYAFFAWLSVFNMFIISLVWSLMADVSDAATGKRAFGVIAAGSSLGGIAGAGAATALGDSVPRLAFLTGGVVLLEGAVWVARAIDQRVPPRRAPERDDLDWVGRRGPRTFGEACAQIGAGAALIARSPYLALICAYLVLYSFASTAMYFEQSEIVGAFLDDRGERRAYLASIDLYVNIIALLGQLFIAGRVMSRLGTWAPLVVLPLISGAALIGLGLGQSSGLAGGAMLSLLAACQVARRSSNYALAKPARETLFTVVSRGEKYKAKNFIDTVVYRGGDAVSGSAFDRLSALIPIAWLPVTLAPLMAAWAAVGWGLSRMQSRRSEPENPPTATRPRFAH